MVFVAFTMLAPTAVAAPPIPQTIVEPAETSDSQYHLVYRMVAEFRGGDVYTDGDPTANPTGLEQTIWCNSCTSTKAWIWTADQQTHADGAGDPSNLGASEEEDFAALIFEWHVEVLVAPCELDGEEVQGCWVASGSALWLTVSSSAPPPAPCPPPGWCPLGQEDESG